MIKEVNVNFIEGRCPLCRSRLLTDGMQIWCSYTIGVKNYPACDYRIGIEDYVPTAAEDQH